MIYNRVALVMAMCLSVCSLQAGLLDLLGMNKHFERQILHGPHRYIGSVTDTKRSAAGIEKRISQTIEDLRKNGEVVDGLHLQDDGCFIISYLDKSTRKWKQVKVLDRDKKTLLPARASIARGKNGKELIKITYDKRANH